MPGPPVGAGFTYDGLLTSDGTVYPLLNRLRDAGLVTSEWRDDEGERARRYYSITEAGRQSLTAFRADWARFSATVGGVLNHSRSFMRHRREGKPSMSGTALDHPMVRGYLRGLDAAMRGLPAAQARELREQITAHLDDALGPGGPWPGPGRCPRCRRASRLPRIAAVRRWVRTPAAQIMA